MTRWFQVSAATTTSAGAHATPSGRSMRLEAPISRLRPSASKKSTRSRPTSATAKRPSGATARPLGSASQPSPTSLAVVAPSSAASSSGVLVCTAASAGPALRRKTMMSVDPIGLKGTRVKSQRRTPDGVAREVSSTHQARSGIRSPRYLGPRSLRNRLLSSASQTTSGGRRSAGGSDQRVGVSRQYHVKGQPAVPDTAATVEWPSAASALPSRTSSTTSGLVWT